MEILWILFSVFMFLNFCILFYLGVNLLSGKKYALMFILLSLGCLSFVFFGMSQVYGLGLNDLAENLGFSSYLLFAILYYRWVE